MTDGSAHIEQCITGQHPINDSPEVQRTVKALGAQSEQLPKIAVNLENIATALAGAQKAGSVRINALEFQLEVLDKEITQALQMEKTPGLTAQQRQQLDAFIVGRETDAINDTRSAVQQMNSIRDGYANTLHQAQTDGSLGPQTAELASDFKLGSGQEGP